MAPVRTVLLANREPFSNRADKGGKPVLTVGGLVSALVPLMSDRPGIWIASRTDSEGGDGRVDVPMGGDDDATYPVRFVGIPDKEYANYYNGVANDGLWPVFHSMIDQFSFDSRHWKDYVSANERFAEATLDEVGDKDLVWVHDYHLMLVPRLLREKKPKLRIGFFLHIPFPGVEIYRAYPRYRPLLQGVLGADLCGFHTERYAIDFAVAAMRLLGANVARDFSKIELDGRTIKVGPYPIGIDATGLEADARKRDRAVAKLRKQLATDHVMLGVDRLDYTKGILERLRAFELFLERHPEARRKIVFVQVAVPSRTRVPAYIAMKRDIEEMVGRINGRFGISGWVPIHYMYRSLGRKDLIAYYRAADIAMVTPRRDGMNLVAKEYVATRLDDDGVLILSELTGAANQLPDAILVNPYDIDSMADAIFTAMTMPDKERRARMSVLRKTVRKQDGDWWRNKFIDDVSAVK